MTRVIITDLDDTLLQFSSAFTKWMTATQGIVPTMPCEDARTVEELFGISMTDALPFITEFFRTPEFTMIAPFDCAANIIPDLRRDGYKFVAITACEASPEIEQARRHNLREAFGFDFDEVHLTGLFVPSGKDPYLKRYDSTIFVEDNEEHALSGANIGHTALLLPRKRNEHFSHDKVVRINDWHDVANMLD